MKELKLTTRGMKGPTKCMKLVREAGLKRLSVTVSSTHLNQKMEDIKMDINRSG